MDINTSEIFYIILWNFEIIIIINYCTHNEEI